jgi:hypothetical protein
LIKEIQKCRICSSKSLSNIISLGNQALTGVFPGTGDPDPAEGPLSLVQCDVCTLVQLKHSFSPDAMYGDNYGYRSGLNNSMVLHLRNKVRSLAVKFGIDAKSVVLDIGSNDGTSCNFWLEYTENVFGMDPTAFKFRQHYDARVTRIDSFFTKESFLEKSKKADLISSVAMFYDLDNPVIFAQDIFDSLSDNGVWHLEQSYLPSMLAANSYDTICHEHVEYYSLTSLNEIFKRSEFKIVDVSLNDINGGSIAVTVAKNSNDNLARSTYAECSVTRLSEFELRVTRHRDELRALVYELRNEGEIWGLGASTKGNVLLQYCGFGSELITAIADVNPDKMDKVTPGTRIPIKGEEAWRNASPKYSLVLPWHFKKSFIDRSSQYFLGGGRLIFPLPRIEIYE